MSEGPAVAEAISMVIGMWQGNSKLIFRISKVIEIKGALSPFLVLL